MSTGNSQSNPVLVNHFRGGVVESFHRGVISVVDESGKERFSLGNTRQVCYPRSALKYFQHIPLLLSGAFDHFEFEPKHLALMCGSHNGEEIHTQTAAEILKKIGCVQDNLGCGAQPPTHKNDYLRLIRANEDPCALHNNCSGKHSGFLAWCKFHNQPLETYLQPEHSLHKEIKRISAIFHEIAESELVTGVDGCSAPIFGMPVYNQAVSYKNLTSPKHLGIEGIEKATERILSAIAENPIMIAGTKRYCTDLVAVTKGRIIGKTGADGIYSIAVPERKWGITIKIDDGRMGPQYNVAQALLIALGLLSEEEADQLKGYLVNDNRNYAGNMTGTTEISHELAQNLKNL